MTKRELRMKAVESLRSLNLYKEMTEHERYIVEWTIESLGDITGIPQPAVSLALRETEPTWFLALDVDELGAHAQVWRRDHYDGGATLLAHVGHALGGTIGTTFDPQDGDEYSPPGIPFPQFLEDLHAEAVFAAMDEPALPAVNRDEPYFVEWDTRARVRCPNCKGDGSSHGFPQDVPGVMACQRCCATGWVYAESLEGS